MEPLPVVSNLTSTDSVYTEYNHDKVDRAVVIFTLIMALLAFLSLLIIFILFIIRFCSWKRPCTFEKAGIDLQYYIGNAKIINPFCFELIIIDPEQITCLYYLGGVFLFMSIIPIFTSALTLPILNHPPNNPVFVIHGIFIGIQFMLLLEILYQRLITIFKITDVTKSFITAWIFLQICYTTTIAAVIVA